MALRPRPFITQLSPLAKYASNIYSKNNFVDSPNVITLPDECNGILTVNEDNLIITCRGTTSLNDWRQNIRCRLKKVDFFGANHNARFHSGYIDTYYDIIQSDWFKKIEEYVLKTDKEILLTGHSSGAAKSILIGLYLANKYTDKQIKIVAFGSPKCANREFFDRIDALPNIDIVTVSLSDDIVPRIGIGINNPYKQITINDFDENVCLNIPKSHSASRYEEHIKLISSRPSKVSLINNL
tara:strand:+ start:2384 stop:3103 length:720 start_codon:yes stop_codon:yes gene_type:complete